MAQSFALGDAGQVVMQEGTKSGAVSTQIEGGGAGGATQTGGVRQAGSDFRGIAATGMKTIEALNKLTDGALKPHIERLEKQQYYEGMSKVAQGQTLMQVEEEDPWYMHLFGPSATVRGAQAMTATTSITQAETDVMSNMPALREQSPDTFRKFLVDQATNIKSTGDPLVDATVQAKLAEGWGPMLKTHMREHLAFQQVDMHEKQTNANVSAGDKLHATRDATGTGWRDEERLAAYADVVEGSKPAYGQGRDSWQKGIAESLRANLMKGNFDYYEAIKASEVWGKIDPKVREQIEYSMPQYVMKDAQSNPAITSLSNDLGALDFNVKHGTSGIGSVEQLDKVLDQYNVSMGMRNGSSEPFINNVKRAQYHEAWMAGQEADRKAGAQAAKSKGDKLAEYEDGKSRTMTAFTTGAFSLMKDPHIDPKGTIDALNGLFDQAISSGDPDTTQKFFARAAQASYEEKLRVPKLQERMKVNLNGLLDGTGPATDEQKLVLGWAQALLTGGNGPDALTNYIGAEAANKVQGMLGSGFDISNDKMLEDQRTRFRKEGVPKADHKERDAVDSILASADPGWFRALNIFGDHSLQPFKLTEETRAGLGSIVAPRAVQYSKTYNTTLEFATRTVLNETLQSADLVGGAIVPRTITGAGDKSLFAGVSRLQKATMNQSDPTYQEAAHNAIMANLKANVEKAGGDMANFNADDYHVTSGTQLGNGYLQLTVLPKDAGKALIQGISTVMLKPEQVSDEITRLSLEKGSRKKKGPVPTPEEIGVAQRKTEPEDPAGLLLAD